MTASILLAARAVQLESFSTAYSDIFNLSHSPEGALRDVAVVSIGPITLPLELED
jgi:hypothetical protein